MEESLDEQLYINSLKPYYQKKNFETRNKETLEGGEELLTWIHTHLYAYTPYLKFEGKKNDCLKNPPERKVSPYLKGNEI